MDYGTGVCPFCRTEFKKKNNVQIYCSRLCRGRSSTANLGKCIHNEGVDCIGTQECFNCGWNPKVSQNRLAIYLAGGSE